MVRIMCLRLGCNILSETVDFPNAFNSLKFLNFMIILSKGASKYK